MKHTPTPWFSFKDNQIESRESPIVWGSGLAKHNKEANAAFIVKACNNHYRLLNTLKQLTSEVYNETTPTYTTLRILQIEAEEAIKQAEAEC